MSIEIPGDAELLRALCALSTDFIMVADRDGRYLAVLETRLPFPDVNQAIGRTMHEMLPEEMADQYVAVIRRALDSGVVQTLRYGFPGPEGKGTIWYEASVSALNATQVLWVARDISQQYALEQAQQRLRMFEALVENTPDAVLVHSLIDGSLLYHNLAFRQMHGYSETDLAGGQFDMATYVAESPEEMARVQNEVREHGVWQGASQLRRRDGTTFPSSSSLFLIADSSDKPVALAGIARDMTAVEQAQQERAALQAQIIEAQELSLRELSTPLIPLAQGVVAMPLVGTIDTRRAQQILEMLLEGIMAQQAEYAILDITGVKVVDTQVASALLQVAQAARLLGAQVILTGISAEVAQALVHLGTDLGTIVTRSNLQSGIAYALGNE